MFHEELTRKIIGAAIEVHKQLGPGLLESVYQACLARELDLTGLHFEQQKDLPVEYKGVRLESGLRLDFYRGRQGCHRNQIHRRPPSNSRSPIAHLFETHRMQSWSINQFQRYRSHERHCPKSIMMRSLSNPFFLRALRVSVVNLPLGNN